MKLSALSRSLAKLGIMTVGLVSLISQATAQTPNNYSAANSTYSESFNGMTTNTTNAALSNQVSSTYLIYSIPGTTNWYAKADASASRIPRFGADSGQSNTGSLYSYGASGSSNRALGGVASAGSGAQPQYLTYGTGFKNTTGSTLNAIVIQFDAQQWRNAGNNDGVSQTTGFFYKVFPSGVLSSRLGVDTYVNSGPIDTTGNSGTTPDSTWTRVTALNITSTFNTGSATSSGLTAALASSTLTATITGLTINNNDEIWVRFLDPNDTGSDHGLGIDNFNFQAYSTPTFTSYSPSPISAGANNPTLTLTGTNFVSGLTKVVFNGTSLTPTVNSATSLTVSVPSNLVAAPGSYPVYIQNGSLNSATVNVTVAAPTITLVSPSSIPVGADSTVFTINGLNFVSSGTGASKVTFNGTSVTTTYVSAAQLTAAVPNNLLTASGTVPIVVSNGANAASDPYNVTIETIANSTPTITSVPAISAGATTLTVNGTNFFNGFSTILWSGFPLTTTYVSATQLTATIPAGYADKPGYAKITVRNTSSLFSNTEILQINDTNASTANLNVAISSITRTNSQIVVSFNIINRGNGTAYQVNLAPANIKLAGTAASSGGITNGQVNANAYIKGSVTFNYPNNDAPASGTTVLLTLSGTFSDTASGGTVGNFGSAQRITIP